MKKPITTMLAALAVVATPVVAQAETAKAPAREAAPVERSAGLGRVATPLLLFLAGAAAVVALILLDKQDNDTPASP